MYSRLFPVVACLLLCILLADSFIPNQAISAPVGSPAHIKADTTKKDTAKFITFKGLPLKAKRKIRVSTTEGSWTSVDISPDGKTILFDLLGDIYSIPSSGGKATPVTS